MLQFILLTLLVAFITGCTPTTKPPVTQSTIIIDQDEISSPVCLSALMTIGYWEKRFGMEVGTLQPLDDTYRLNILRGFNNSPPISEYNSEEVYLILAPDRTTIIMILYNKECVTYMQSYPRAVIDEWLSINSESLLNL